MLLAAVGQLQEDGFMSQLTKNRELSKKMMLDYKVTFGKGPSVALGEMSSAWYAQSQLDSHHALLVSRHSEKRTFLTSLVKCNSEGKVKTNSTAETDSGEHSVNMLKKPRSSTY